MPEAHAILSASGSSRWISCPASVKASEGIESSSSAAAEEGTLAHEVAYLIARERLTGDKPTAIELASVGEYDPAMDVHGNEYADAVQASYDRIADSSLFSPLVFFEKAVQTGIPNCWGTADCIIVGDDEIEVIDYKYGKGLYVDATDNSQLKIYGLGALHTLKLEKSGIQRVRLTIHQPRNGTNPVRSWDTTAESLLDWRKLVLPIAKDALNGSRKFGPSVKACKFCPVAPTCRARQDHALSQDFEKQPTTLTPKELAEALERIPFILKWCEEVKDYALKGVAGGTLLVPGWKAVTRRGNRYIHDVEALVHKGIDDYGFKPEQLVSYTTRPLGELEKLVGGRKNFDQAFGEFVDHKPDSTSLVVDTDPREAKVSFVNRENG